MFPNLAGAPYFSAIYYPYSLGGPVVVLITCVRPNISKMHSRGTLHTAPSILGALFAGSIALFKHARSHKRGHFGAGAGESDLRAWADSHWGKTRSLDLIQHHDSHPAYLRACRLVHHMRRAVNVDTSGLGRERVICVPGLTVTVAEMLEAVARVGHADVQRLVARSHRCVGLMIMWVLSERRSHCVQRQMCGLSLRVRRQQVGCLRCFFKLCVVWSERRPHCVQRQMRGLSLGVVGGKRKHSLRAHVHSAARKRGGRTRADGRLIVESLGQQSPALMAHTLLQ